MDKIICTYPRVTEILSKAGLTKYYDMPDKQYYLDRGSIIHKICEYHDKKILDIKSVDEQVKGYYEAYLSFLNDYKPVVKYLELHLISEKYKYQGTLDRVFDFMKCYILTDIKTGKPGKGVKYQTIAYKIALEEQEEIKIKERWSLELKNNGKYLIEIYKDDVYDWNKFLGALNQIKKENKNNE